MQTYPVCPNFEMKTKLLHMLRRKKIIVIGSGFAGLSAACFLAKAGHDVTILEKNGVGGGRARQFKTDGFTFDMGPSWYWMPEVFENFFKSFDKSTLEYYELVRLSPSYSIFFGQNEIMDLPANRAGLFDLFEKYEPGSSKNLEQFLNEAAYKYKVAMSEFVYKPGHSIFEFADIKVLKSLFNLHMFTSMSKYIRKLFSNEKLIQLLEFPVLFLGATPEKTPALYSLMNHADLSLGTWYPMGGMFKIVEGMMTLAKELGVQIKLVEPVTKINASNNKATSVVTEKAEYQVDIVVGSADYHHIEQQLLSTNDQQYNSKYWDKRVMAPSSLLFYLGVDKKLKNLHHHNLFFDEDFKKHAIEIYESPAWPEKPLFYVCCPSKTDDSVAPEGKENVFVLIPLAPGLEDSEEIRDKYYHIVMDRLEKLTGQSIKEEVIYKRSFAHRDFTKDYNAFKGNAYGLANTLLQTAFLKPKMKSKKVKNLYFTGQLTTPGPGVPPSIISGEVVAKEINESISKKQLV